MEQVKSDGGPRSQLKVAACPESRRPLRCGVMDGVHDLGGMHGFGPVPVDDDSPGFREPWEVRVWALSGPLMRRTTIDRFRYSIERMAPVAYLTSSYFGRWLHALETLATDPELLDRSPVARPAPNLPPPPCRFATGDRVRVRNAVTAGHTRVPRYLRRQPGTVRCVACVWPDPARSAATGVYGGPVVHYTVSFAAVDLFGPGADHVITADVIETDLEAA